jgi:hypothetical protein
MEWWSREYRVFVGVLRMSPISPIRRVDKLWDWLELGSKVKFPLVCLSLLILQAICCTDPYDPSRCFCLSRCDVRHPLASPRGLILYRKKRQSRLKHTTSVNERIFVLVHPYGGSVSFRLCGVRNRPEDRRYWIPLASGG